MNDNNPPHPESYLDCEWHQPPRTPVHHLHTPPHPTTPPPHTTTPLPTPPLLSPAFFNLMMSRKSWALGRVLRWKACGIRALSGGRGGGWRRMSGMWERGVPLRGVSKVSEDTAQRQAPLTGHANSKLCVWMCVCVPMKESKGQICGSSHGHTHQSPSVTWLKSTVLLWDSICIAFCTANNFMFTLSMLMWFVFHHSEERSYSKSSKEAIMNLNMWLRDIYLYFIKFRK